MCYLSGANGENETIKPCFENTPFENINLRRGDKMKLTMREKSRDIPVMVISESKERYGVVIGTSNDIVGILLNTGEYIDAPASAVRRIRRLKK